jgi:hypothetical protein
LFRQGETAVSGFVRFWKPWGVLFCLFTILPNMWPGWATSGVTILTFLMGGGDVPLITIGILVASGIALTTSPVVYQTLERAQFFKVGLTLVFLPVAAAAPATGSMMRQDAENIRRFHGWWAVAKKEQLVSFWFICVFSITIFSTLAYSTVFGQTIAGQANLAFIKAEGEALKTIWT